MAGCSILRPERMRRAIFCSTATASRKSLRQEKSRTRAEPGQENSETIETGTRAAARGGFTVVCSMPNTQPVNDNASITRFIVDRAKAHGHVRVWPIGAASMGSKGEAIAEIAAMRDAGIVAVSDDGKPISSAKLARQIMDYCRTLDLPVIEHAEDVSLAAGAVMREGI